MLLITWKCHLIMYITISFLILVISFGLGISEQDVTKKSNSNATSELDSAHQYRDDRVFCAKMMSYYFTFAVYNFNLVHGKWTSTPTSNTEIETPEYREFGPNNYFYICSRGVSWSIYGTEGFVNIQKIGSNIPMELAWNVTWNGDIWYEFDHHNLFEIYHRNISDDNHEFTFLGPARV